MYSQLNIPAKISVRVYTDLYDDFVVVTACACACACVHAPILSVFVSKIIGFV